MELSAELLDHVARLARLDLSEAEREAFRRTLADLLTLFEELPEAAGMPEPAFAGSLREDAVSPWEDVGGLVANVPETREGRIRVGRERG